MPLTSCQSSMTLQAQKVQKLIPSPFIMRVIAINIAPTPINTFATLPACIRRLARQAPPWEAHIALSKFIKDRDTTIWAGTGLRIPGTIDIYDAFKWPGDLQSKQ